MKATLIHIQHPNVPYIWVTDANRDGEPGVYVTAFYNGLYSSAEFALEKRRKAALGDIEALLDNTRPFEVDDRKLPTCRCVVFMSTRPVEEMIPELAELVKEKCMLLTG